MQRTLAILFTLIPRAFHRHGFGVQSPSDYELVRDVLFESLPYYAYSEQGLTTPSQQQLFRIRNHFRNSPIVIIDSKGEQAACEFQNTIKAITPETVLIIEHINRANSKLWEQAVSDSRCILTFDMRKRGLILFTPKRIKQNYLL